MKMLKTVCVIIGMALALGGCGLLSTDEVDMEPASMETEGEKPKPDRDS
jgi:hypothetical protein